MFAMIFAAGLGTRLKPLTNDCPKALVKIDGEPMLKYAIEKLIRSGVTDIVINVHHFADQIKEFITQNDFGVKIYISDETSQLLNTGGGLKNAQELLKTDKPFFVVNVDVISDIDYADIYTKHIESGSIATLAVKDRSTSRYLLFNDEGRLCGWKNKKTGEMIEASNCDSASEMAFSGLQVISPELFNEMDCFDGAFSIIDVYLKIAATKKIASYDHTAGMWMDLGKFDEVTEADKMAQKIKAKG